MEEVFADLQVWLAAENGAVIRPAGSKVRGLSLACLARLLLHSSPASTCALSSACLLTA